jgi:hypothetical protein
MASANSFASANASASADAVPSMDEITKELYKSLFARLEKYGQAQRMCFGCIERPYEALTYEDRIKFEELGLLVDASSAPSLPDPDRDDSPDNRKGYPSTSKRVSCRVCNHKLSFPGGCGVCNWKPFTIPDDSGFTHISAGSPKYRLPPGIRASDFNPNPNLVICNGEIVGFNNMYTKLVPYSDYRQFSLESIALFRPESAGRTYTMRFGVIPSEHELAEANEKKAENGNWLISRNIEHDFECLSGGVCYCMLAQVNLGKLLCPQFDESFESFESFETFP